MSQHRSHSSRDSFDSSKEAKDQKVAPRLPRVKLVLHSGLIDDMMFVVRTIMELTRFCVAEATHKMWQAHHFGQAQLLETYLERAELYVEQFADRGLRVTIETAKA